MGDQREERGKMRLMYRRIPSFVYFVLFVSFVSSPGLLLLPVPQAPFSIKLTMHWVRLSVNERSAA
jgi:hypothetical protein